MTETTQENYERRLAKFAQLIHGTDEDGLICKLQLYSSFLAKHRSIGDTLWKIEPLLFYLIKSLEQDVHLTVAKFFEDKGLGIRKFLNFCISKQPEIIWSAGKPPDQRALRNQVQRLEKHKKTIEAIKGRRNKVFAHRDKQYLDDKDKIYTDYPLSEKDVRSLANTLISIVCEHQTGLSGGSFSFHIAEFFEISVDNMVRNLEAGRRLNFPDQKME